MSQRNARNLHSHRRIVSLLMISQKFACFYCSRPILLDVAENHPARATLDHKTPPVFGGEPFGDNAVAACRLCNSWKGCLDAKVFLDVRSNHPRRRHLLREAQREISNLSDEDRRAIRKHFKMLYRESWQSLWDRLRPDLESYKAGRAVDLLPH